MVKTKTLMEWHAENHLEVVALDGGKNYYVVPVGEDMGGHLDGVMNHANVENWKVIEKEGKLFIPTYAYDRILVATLPGSIPLTTLKCQRCGHAWHPRSHEAPERCPGCNSPYWNKPRTR